MRRIHHPGPPAAQRHVAQPCLIEHGRPALPCGVSLLAAFGQLCQDHQAGSAVATLRGGSLEPMAYVMPALSKTPAHAVFYSERYALDGPARLESAALTVGRRDGKPWLHCHAIWRDAQGRLGAGHILPDEAVVATAPVLDIWYLHGADFAVTPCQESGFSLFTPVATGGAPAPAQKQAHAPASAFALSIRPNEDVCEAIAAVCRRRGVARAAIRGGVGSLVGVAFADGTHVEPFVTEVFIERGTVDATRPGGEGVCLDVGVVDHCHGIHRGRLRPGANAVLVTFEMVIEPLA
ncbi:MAG: DUF296 domain-containing protein [Comamonadaceae bacterium]|nr:DUF296 domain-containing protein [Comamonadaceae bacterium]